MANRENGIELTEIQSWIVSNLSSEAILAFATEDKVDEAADLIPLLAGRKPLQGKESIFLCRQLHCEKPLYDLSELQKLLENDSYLSLQRCSFNDDPFP